MPFINTSANKTSGDIIINHLSVQNRKRSLLNMTYVRLPYQQITVIIGANGAGKSTFIHALLGQKADCQINSDIHINKQPLHDLVKQAKIAWVGQHEQFELPLNVLEYATLGVIPHLAWYQMPDGNMLADAEKKLIDFGLIHLKNNRLQTLSGGEKQRLAMVRALMQNTDILLLDEPTNHLDIKYQRFLLTYLQRLQKDEQKTIIMVLHDLSHAYQCADWVIALHQGNLLAQGTPDVVMTEQNLTTMYETPIHSVMTNAGKLFY